jgi:cholesterol 7-dehydrogenase
MEEFLDKIRSSPWGSLILQAIVVAAVGWVLFWLLIRTFHVPLRVRAREQLLKVNPQTRLESYPPPFLNSWYKLFDSDEVKKGEIKFLTCCNQDLVVFRGQDGVAHVVDAYCPHLGANIGTGKVVGNCIQCPFHMWEFRGSDGACTKIPTPDVQIPENAKLKAWPTLEKYGMILFYFDAEGRKPDYFPPDVEGVSDNKMWFRGSYDDDIRMHCVEFIENSGDFQHFPFLHYTLSFPYTDISVPLLRIKHVVSWDARSDTIAVLHDYATLTLFGRPLHKPVLAQVTFAGPGCFAIFEFFIPSLGKIVLFHTHTPLEPFMQRTSFRWWSDRHLPGFFCHYVIGNWISQYYQDVIIWTNKRYARKPLLTKVDGPMPMVRRWYKKFYSENSENVGRKKVDVTDW